MTKLSKAEPAETIGESGQQKDYCGVSKRYRTSRVRKTHQKRSHVWADGNACVIILVLFSRLWVGRCPAERKDYSGADLPGRLLWKAPRQ